MFSRWRWATSSPFLVYNKLFDAKKLRDKELTFKKKNHSKTEIIWIKMRLFRFFFSFSFFVNHLFCSSSNSSSSSWLMTSEASHWNSCSSVISEYRLSHSSILVISPKSSLFNSKYCFLESSWCFESLWIGSRSACLCHSKLGDVHLTQRRTEIDRAGNEKWGVK